MLATRRGLALAPSWYARAHTRALRYTCACLRANFLCRSLTRFEFDGEAWSKYFSRRRDTQSGFVRRLNSTLTSNPSLKYSLHGSFVFCSEIYLSLFLVCSLFIRFKIFSIRFLFSFFWKNFLIIPLLWISLHCIIRFRTSPPTNRFPPSCSSLPPRGPCKVTYY